MTPSLSAEQRTVLERFVQRTRQLVEDDLKSTLEGRFGIHPSGAVEGAESLSLSNALLATRAELIDVLSYLRSEGEDARSAVDRLVREAAFTHTNRLVAVRIAEAIGLVSESMSRGLASTGFRDFSELAPIVADTDWGRFAMFVRLCADELAPDIPALFDPRNPLLDLTMSEPALAQVVGAMVDVPSDVWAAPDALGWAYQFFNTGDERTAIRKGGAPRTSVELAVSNQFFTPGYVVDFLVHNGLGAHLVATYPQLSSELPYLLDAKDSHDGVNLEEVTVLDPACGSGHFLLGAYDVLESAWQYAGVPPEDAAPRIVAALWGIDIDPRATQIAQAAIMFRARRHRRTLYLPPANTICARPLSLGASAEALLATLPERVARTVRRVAAELADASVLGPLLRIEERLDREARDFFGTGDVAGALSEVTSTSSEVEGAVLATLQSIADSTASTPAERLFAAEARDAVRFVEAMTRRYTAVLMNPPFGDPVPRTKTYLKATYPWIPATSDLFALFVGRGLELSEPNGSVGAITSRVGLFLTSFEKWRSEVLLRNALGPLVDLGEGVMEQAMVEAAAYVLRRSREGTRNAEPVFLRAVTTPDRGRAIEDAVKAIRGGAETAFVYRPDLGALQQLSGAPVAYWIDPADVRHLLTHDPFEPAHGVVRQGLATGDDFQFVRAWWEVDTDRLTCAPDLAGGYDERFQLEHGARWAPIVKAGSSQPWFSPNLLVVDWERDGYRLKRFTDVSGALRSRPQNVDYYFKPGFSWTRRAPRLVPYVVPAGCIASVSRYQAFPNGDPYTAIGVVASNVATAFARFYGEKFLWPNFLVDNVKSIPVPELPGELQSELASHVEASVAERRAAYQQLEPFREFVAPTRESPKLDWNPFSLLGPTLESRIAHAYGLDEDAVQRVELDLREALRTLGNAPTDEQEDGDDAVDPGSWADRLVSYLVGVAFGRWDVRIGNGMMAPPPLPGAFDPPRRIPPGALIDGQGLPATLAPENYPIDLPNAWCLVDQSGHAWDIEARVRSAATAFLGSDRDLEEAIALVMARPTVRGYLRQQFFKSHLATYSRGRRRAPIYWPLQVPSKNWGVWLYAPRLSRETLFAVVREADQRRIIAEQQVAHLQRESTQGGGSRSASALAKEVDFEQRLAVELAAFRDEAERIANLSWEPDLDDGLILNAAPLADLLPSWKDPSAYRNQLRKGEYEWATVARFADRL